MSRLLFTGCPPGGDEANLQNEIEEITGHSKEVSAVFPDLTDSLRGIQPPRDQVCEQDNEHTPDKQRGGRSQDASFSRSGLQIRRLRGGTAGGEGDGAGIRTGDEFMREIPAAARRP